MSRYHGNGEACPVCGLKYRNLQTGLTFQAVHDLLKDYSDDPNDWTYKRRHTVLGKWFQIKQELWAQHRWECEQQRLFEESERRVHGDAYEHPDVVYSGPTPGSKVPF